MRLAAYCRVSTDKEEQLHSMETQKQFFSDFAEQNGHTLVKLYADEGISGTSLRRRAEFNRLIEDAKRGLFDLVAVKDISRMARNTVDFLQSIRTLKSMGVNTIFVTSNMSTLGDSEFTLTIFGALAQEESASLSKRVKFGKLINSQKGRVPRVIFGYDKVDNFTLAINPLEAEIVRGIYNAYVLEGMGCRKIAAMLNEMGAKTKFGYDWDTTGVKRILSNPIYSGELVNRKYEVKDYLSGKLVKLPPEQNLHHDRPELAVISKETWSRAQEILAMRRKQYDSGGPFRGARFSSRHVFSTLIQCGCCGSTFTRKTYTYVNTRVYWKCRVNDQKTKKVCPNNVKVDEQDLIDAVREYFSRVVEDKDAFVQSVVEEVLARRDDLVSQRAAEAMEKKLEGLAKKREKAQELYLQDLIAMDQLEVMLQKIDEEADVVSKKLMEWSAYTINSAEKLKELARGYAEEIERFLRFETITNMDLRRIIESITVFPDKKITINIKKMANP